MIIPLNRNKRMGSKEQEINLRMSKYFFTYTYIRQSSCSCVKVRALLNLVLVRLFILRRRWIKEINDFRAPDCFQILLQVQHPCNSFRKLKTPSSRSIKVSSTSSSRLNSFLLFFFKLKRTSFVWHKYRSYVDQ